MASEASKPTISPLYLSLYAGEPVWSDDGPFDVYIRNEGEQEWLYAGRTRPYKTRWPDGRVKGQRVPEYGHLVTGSSHDFRMTPLGEKP